jgi:hypothetical protein
MSPDIWVECVAAAAEDVKDLVDLQVDPPYAAFYELVHHTQALVPLLSDPRYYQSKFSSTVITSLVTGGLRDITTGIDVERPSARTPSTNR